MKLLNLAIWTLVSALSANADWAPFDINTTQCQQCIQGQGILLFTDDDIEGFCRGIMDACADGQVDKTTYNGEDNAAFIWDPMGAEGNDACPSTMDRCTANVAGVRGGACPTNTVTASGEIQLDSGGRAGLVIITGGCFCASPQTC